MDESGRSGLTDMGEDLGDGIGIDMGEDLGDGLGIGEECDERERRLTGWADEGKNLVDPSQEGGSSGRPGRGGVGWLAWCRL